jgi:hypothetical protein
VGEDNRRLWAEWVAREIGGDAARQQTALAAAMQVLQTGGAVNDASSAARAAVGAAPAPPPVTYFQAGPLRCRFCGSLPAVPMTIYEHNGYLILMTFKNLKGPFCRSCGLNVWRRMTDATLLRGWLGMFSFFIAPVTALINVVNLSKLTSLPAPDPSSSMRAPADPGEGLFRRAGVYVYIGVIAIVLLFFLLPVVLAGRS